jgi:hypothetical protein
VKIVRNLSRDVSLIKNAFVKVINLYPSSSKEREAKALQGP